LKTHPSPLRFKQAFAERCHFLNTRKAQFAIDKNTREIAATAKSWQNSQE
jgi:hypothetical protein